MSANIIFGVMFVIFAGLLLMGGVISRRWVKESSDFILAGREVSTPINIMGVCAIGFAGTSISLGPGLAMLLGFNGGMAFSIIYCILGLGGFGLFYSAFIRRCGAQTLPEYLEMRYGPRVRSVVSVTSIIGMCGILANNIVSCQVSIVGYTGWNPTLVMAAIFVIIIAFTFMSGLWAATINDFIQVIIGVIVVPTFLLLLWQRYGGLDAVASVWPNYMTQGISGASLPTFGLTYPSMLNFLICFAAALVWGNNYYWMKIASCRSEKVARNSFVIAAVVLVVVFNLPFALIGLFAGGFHGEVFTLGGGTVPYTGAYGFMASTFTPLLGSFFVIGAMAASISTASTSALGASAVATRDIYQRLINPKADSKKTLRASKIAMLFIGIFTFLLCQFPGGPTYLFAFANSWLIPPGILVLFGIFWRRFNERGAFFGSLLGMITMAVFTLLDLTGIFLIGQYIYPATLGFIVTLVASVIITFTDKPKYYGEPGWERVPTATNRIEVQLDETDLKVLELIRVGHRYMADITDTLGMDSRTTGASIDKMDQGGYIMREGLNRSAFYTFEITEKGLAALPALSEGEAAMEKEFLTPMYVELLGILKNNPDQQAAFVQKHAIKSMHMAAISSHLTRRGYVVEGGLFKRKLRLTDKGAAAFEKFATAVA